MFHSLQYVSIILILSRISELLVSLMIFENFISIFSFLSEFVLMTQTLLLFTEKKNYRQILARGLKC